LFLLSSPECRNRAAFHSYALHYLLTGAFAPRV